MEVREAEAAVAACAAQPVTRAATGSRGSGTSDGSTDTGARVPPPGGLGEWMHARFVRHDAVSLLHVRSCASLCARNTCVQTAYPHTPCLSACGTQDPAPLQDTPLVWVRDTAGVIRLAAALVGERAVAVDVEHHARHSFTGVTCLVQLSTRTHDYIIDTLCSVDLAPLQSIMGDVTVVKVLHGCDTVPGVLAADHVHSRRFGDKSLLPPRAPTICGSTAGVRVTLSGCTETAASDLRMCLTPVRPPRHCGCLTSGWRRW